METSQLAETFEATVLFQNNKYSIEMTKRNELCVVIDALFTDFVVVYDNGNISFNKPHALPKYIREKVQRFANKYFEQINPVETVSFK